MITPMPIPSREDWLSSLELAHIYKAKGRDVDYGPTPVWLIQELLKYLEIGPDDHVVDIGCGDARILIEAAKLGASCIGIESCLERHDFAQKLVDSHYLSAKVMLVNGDFRSYHIPARTTHLISFMWPGLVDTVVEHTRRTVPEFTATSILHRPSWAGRTPSLVLRQERDDNARADWPIWIGKVTPHSIVNVQGQEDNHAL